MRAIIGLATFIATFVAVGSAASATECVNGLTELGNGVILKCDPVAFDGRIVLPVDPVQPDEPIHTGSIPTTDEGMATQESTSAGSSAPSGDEEGIIGGNPTEGSLAAEDGQDNSVMVESSAECRPGKYRMVEWEGAEVILACPRHNRLVDNT